MAASLLFSCELVAPEVIVLSRLPPAMLVKDLSFSGCSWPGVLAAGEATSPQRCLVGEDRVHFKRLDVSAYCRQRRQDPAVSLACASEQGWMAVRDAGLEPGTDAVPLWFNYQTIAAHRVGLGELSRLELRLEELDQDFAVPGPFGH